MSLEEEVWRIKAEVTGIESYDKLDKKLDDVGKTAEKTTGKTANFGQSMLQTGRIAQDFAQGGIGGIINNIEGAATALGGGAGLAGVMTAVGVGFLLLKPVIMDFWKSLQGPTKPLEEIETGLDRINTALKKNNDELEKMKEKTTLTADEEARYLELVRKGAELEKEKADQVQRQNDLKKLMSREEPGVAEEAAERAKLLQESGIGSAREARHLMDSVRSGLDATKVDAAGKVATDLQRQMDAFDTGTTKEHPVMSQAKFEEFTKLQAKLTQARNEEQKAINALQGQAQELVTKAMERGDLGAFRKIQEQMAQRPGAFTEQQRMAFEQASPEAVEAEREFDRGIARVQEAGRKRREAAAEQRRQAAEDERFKKGIIGELKAEPEGPAAVGEEKAPKGRVNVDTPEELERRGLAQQIMQRTAKQGMPFTEQESMEAAGKAQEAIAAMGRFGKGAAAKDRAIVEAMNAELMTIQEAYMAFMWVKNQVNQMGNQQQQLRQGFQGGMTAQPMGQGN